jgi:hypothetical protein
LKNKGGWIKIDCDTFIEIVETKQRCILQFAKNVSIAPEHHYFELKKGWRYYFLYFLPISMQDCSINIIEEKNQTSNAFNY